MKKHILLAGLIVITTLLQAQDIKRGFKALEKSEYDKAKDAFQKVLSGDSKNVGANFGLALIYADDQTPAFDIIQAWKHAEVMKDRVGELNQEDLDIIAEYFLETEVRRTSRPVKKKIEIALETVEDKLIKYVREENDLTIAYAVLDNFPDYRHYDNVIHIRNQLEFRKFEKQNTLQGYKDFIQKYPDAAQVPKAQRYIYKLEFEEVKKRNLVGGYNEYLKKYPKSEYYQTAIKLRNQAAFNQAKSINTMEAYDNFLNNYPDALQVPDAKLLQRELLYNYAKQIKSLDAYNNFIAKYPEGKYYIDIFNLKAGELGKSVISGLSGSLNNIEWCKQLDNNRWIEKAKDLAVTQNNEYVLVGETKQHTDTYSDAWIVKLDKEGRMLWNKTVGQPFNDEVLGVMINSANQILVLGYTYLSADSASKRGWLFKLGVNGEKIWNKNLGEMDILSWTMNSKDQIIVGTYKQIDSVNQRCKLIILNKEGKTMWQRDYLQDGSFNTVSTLPGDEILAAGGKWLILTDNRRYLKWEDTLQVEGKSEKTAYSSYTGCTFGVDNMYGPLFLNYSTDGKKKWSKQLSYEIPGSKLISLCATNQNIISLEGNKDRGTIRVLNISGTETSKKPINNYYLVKVIEDKEGKVLLVLYNEDFVILKLANALL